MPRKKNRAKQQREKVIDSSVKVYRMGGYVRKSMKEDSIENQKLLIQKYMEESEDLSLHKFYEDNGKTGTNFNRSGFELMIDDMRNGVIDGIIVKDITRFGREHLIIGDYIEKVFPFLGIRFISILDKYDTIVPDCNKEFLAIKLKSLVGELYALDISKKVKGSAKIKAEKGECYGNRSLAYGLKVKPGEKIPHIDYRAAKIIRKIVGWYIAGASNQIIRYKLYNRRIASPGQYRRIRSVYVPKTMEVEFWGRTSINTILTNIEYTGIRVTHKSEKSLYDGIKKHEVPESERTYISDVIPIIIKKDIYDVVQKIREERKNKYTMHRDDGILPFESLDENIFSGLFLCGDCGSYMGRRNTRIHVDGRPYNLKVFYCRAHMNNNRKCDSKTIKEMELLSIIRESIKTLIVQIEDAADTLNTICHGCFTEELNEIESKLKLSKDKEMLIINKKTENLLEYQKGTISEDEFLKRRIEMADCIKGLCTQRTALNKRKSYLNQTRTILQKLSKELLIYNGDISDEKIEDYKLISKELLSVFVEKIYLYQDKRVEIKLRYQDLINQCVIMLVSIREEETL